MGGHRRLPVACLFAFLAVVYSGPTEYYLQQHCNSTIDTFSSALLKVNSWWWAGPGDCNVRIHAVHNRDSQVRLEVLDLQAPCQSLWMTLSDGPAFQDYRHTVRPISPMLCNDSWRQEPGMYLTTTDTLTITLHPGTGRPPSPHIAIKLLATSTSTSSMYGDFECDNMFEIIGDLKCDGYNNCGDWSDESHDVCQWTLRVGLISGSCAIVVLVIVLIVVVVVIRRRRRRRAASAGPVANRPEVGKGEPPSYLSVQGRENPGYIASPPPYNTDNVTMPPPANP